MLRCLIKAAGFFLLPLLFFIATCQDISAQTALPDSCWADSVYYSLNWEQRIAQLIFIRVNKDDAFLPEATDNISRFDIGGIVFFKGTPYKQARWTNYYQSLARTPLLVTIDAERGLGMRLDSAFGFPYSMTLAATGDDSLVYRMASEIGRECRRMGIQVNFAPVVDINSNPLNPVINARSFGEDKRLVTRMANAYINGLRKEHIFHTAKHFPGHGDTDSDSHLTLPVIRHSLAQLKNTDLYPYRELMKNGLEGIMVAHLYVPVLDSGTLAASTLSRPIITDLLRNEMDFRGLVFTDALEMKGVTKYYKPGDIEVKALMAGNDVLLMPVDVAAAIRSIKLAMDSCLIWPEDIEEKCMKVLELKHSLGLARLKPIDTRNLYKDLNPTSNEALSREIYAKAISLLKNDHKLVPVDRLDTLQIASVITGESTPDDYSETLGKYAPVKQFYLRNNASAGETDSLLKHLEAYNLVIIGVMNTSILAEKNFGIYPSTLALVNGLKNRKRVILALFGNPYAFAKYEELSGPDAILVSYQDSRDAYELMAEAIFGSIPVQGELPVSAPPRFPLHTGLKIPGNGRLSYNNPGELNLPDSILACIDNEIAAGIKEKAYPGCQVLFAWKGKVVYQKSFGNHEYSTYDPVRNTDLFDLASITKVAATTLAIMKLYDDGLVDPDQRLGFYLPAVKGTNKENLVIRDIMTHQARLEPWIPFYRKVIIRGKPDTNIFSHTWSAGFPLQVADSLFINKNYPDTMMRMIYRSPLEPGSGYKYSDLGFILLREVVEAISHESLDSYVERNFYRPLGLATMCYNPLKKFSAGRIVPTELDTAFRKQLVHGYVHDPTAAMFGGISGHAGLFSDANDLAIIMQMLLNKGEYAGRRFLKPETVSIFTSAQNARSGNRRGLGFDRPALQYAQDGPACKGASRESFGHSGFTGTYIWADPEQQLVYIFLSNRVYPDAYSNNKLAKLNIRTRVHQLFYDAISAGEKKSK